MTIHNAIEEIEKIYKPGCIEFYAKMPNDPWQSNNDQFEKEVSARIDTERACQRFVETATDLVNKYAEFYVKPKHLSMLDAFMTGSEHNLKVLNATIESHCYVCQTKDNLVMHRDGHTKQVTLVCKECKKNLFNV